MNRFEQASPEATVICKGITIFGVPAEAVTVKCLQIEVEPRSIDFFRPLRIAEDFFIQQQQEGFYYDYCIKTKDK